MVRSLAGKLAGLFLFVYLFVSHMAIKFWIWNLSLNFLQIIDMNKGLFDESMVASTGSVSLSNYFVSLLA